MNLRCRTLCIWKCCGGVAYSVFTAPAKSKSYATGKIRPSAVPSSSVLWSPLKEKSTLPMKYSNR
jgi:hypothetical protein